MNPLTLAQIAAQGFAAGHKVPQVLAWELMGLIGRVEALECHTSSEPSAAEESRHNEVGHRSYPPTQQGWDDAMRDLGDLRIGFEQQQHFARVYEGRLAESRAALNRIADSTIDMGARCLTLAAIDILDAP